MIPTNSAQLWIGVVEVSATPENPAWPGNKDAFVNVVTWASSEQEFKAKADEMFLSYGVRTVGFDRIHVVGDPSELENDEMFEIALRVRDNQQFTVFGPFHTWTSDTKIT